MKSRRLGLPNLSSGARYPGPPLKPKKRSLFRHKDDFGNNEFHGKCGKCGKMIYQNFYLECKNCKERFCVDCQCDIMPTIVAHLNDEKHGCTACGHNYFVIVYNSGRIGVDTENDFRWLPI